MLYSLNLRRYYKYTSYMKIVGEIEWKCSDKRNLIRMNILYESWWFDILLSFQFGLFCKKWSTKFLIAMLFYHESRLKKFITYKDQQIVMGFQ